MSCSHCYFFLRHLFQIMSATWRQKTKWGGKKENEVGKDNADKEKRRKNMFLVRNYISVIEHQI